jgi:hypothetical protein
MRDKWDGEHLGSFEGVADLWLSPSWQGLAALAAEGFACRLDEQARRARRPVPVMGVANPCVPPPYLLKAIRAHAGNRSRRPTRSCHGRPGRQEKVR